MSYLSSYQATYIRMLGNKEILEKSQNWAETEPTVQSSFQK